MYIYLFILYFIIYVHKTICNYSTVLYTLFHFLLFFYFSVWEVDADICSSDCFSHQSCLPLDKPIKSFLFVRVFLFLGFP